MGSILQAKGNRKCASHFSVKAVYALDGKEEEAKYDEEEEEEEEEDKEDEEEEEGEGEDVLVEYKYKSSVEASSFFCVLPF